MGKDALINDFFKEGARIAPSRFFEELKQLIQNRKILHLTHRDPDCDGIASIYWGLKFFGGDFFLSGIPSASAMNLLDFLSLEFQSKKFEFKEYDIFFIYDTEKLKALDYVDLNKRSYILFDHHPKTENDLINGAILSCVSVNSANVVNLYEISKQMDISLDEQISFAFACGLFTDTGMLRTARGKELNYLAEFLGDRRIENVMEVVYSKLIKDVPNFLKRLSKCSIYNISDLKIAVMDFLNKNEFFTFVDSFFRVLDIDVLLGNIPEGVKIYLKKKHSQKIYNNIIIPFQKRLGIKRDHATLLEFHDVEKLLKEIEEKLIFPKKH